MSVTHVVAMCCVLGVAHTWHLMMKVPQGASLGKSEGVYDLWTSNYTLNKDLENPMNVQPGKPYKSEDVLYWDNRTISLVKIGFYKAGEEVAFVVFGAAGADTYRHTHWPVFQLGTNITSWFDCSRIVYSTWGDIREKTPPELCSIHSVATVDHSFSILNSSGLNEQSDCANTTGWFTVMEPGSSNSVIQCPWQPQSSPPHILFSPGNHSEQFTMDHSADVFAIYVDDCIDEELCRHGDCWQDPLGECYCHGYKCTETCSKVPCAYGEQCYTDPKNESAYTCQPCQYGYFGVRCKEKTVEESLSGGAIVGICVSIVVCLAIVGVAIWCFYMWRHRQDNLTQKMTERAAHAKDFVRRSVHRLSGRDHQYPRRHLREENPSPPTKGKSEQLSPDSSIVFGETNPAYTGDDLPAPNPTPSSDRKYTEFPTRPVVAVSTNEIQLHQRKQAGPRSDSNVPADVHYHKRYENVQVSHSELRTGDNHHHSDYDRASTIGSFEKASTMSEYSDATSTSGYSDHTADVPGNLPVSEMISKDVMPRHGHHRHKARPRPRSRTSTADPPRTLAPQTPESQINYALERSRRSISSLSSMSSDATHRSDGTQRSGELTKSDALRARYENVISNNHGDPAGRNPRLNASDQKQGLSYNEIKKQLDADMCKREARERKRLKELEIDTEFEVKRDLQHRMRQVESLDSGIDAENNGGDRNSDGKLEIVRARSADQLGNDSAIRFCSREASV